MGRYIYLIQLVLVYIWTSTTDAQNCPAAEISFPCRCSTGYISCTEATSSLKPIFTRISAALGNEEKKFGSLYIDNTGITELEEEVFSDITFERINIQDESRLTRIHVNAFKSSTNELKEIYFWGASNVSNLDGNYQALRAFGSLVNLERLFFSLNGLQDIPDNAFTTSNVQPKLWQLYLINSGNNHVRSIGNYAFYYMTGITNLELYSYQIEHISRHAFDFFESSSQRLWIALDHNNLNATSFETEAFLHAKRPITVSLGRNRIEYLDENVFLAFLLADSNNRLSISENPVICDCRMFWLYLRKASLESQVGDFVCDNGVTFWNLESSHFDQCYGI